MKKILQTLTILTLAVQSSLFAFELAPTTELLASYLEKDSDIQTAAISYQQAQLNNMKTEINNGFDITLSTGTMTLKASEDGSSFTVSPTAKISIPEVSNLGITAGSTFSFGDSKSDSALSDASLKVNIDLLSSSSLDRKITLMQSERKVLEAKRKFETTALNREKQFYSTLSNLLSQISTIISKQQDLFNDTISFEETKAKGFGTNTSNYRSAELKLQSDKHEIEKAERKLKNEYTLFYKQCGRELVIDDITDYMSLIPSDIPEVEGVDITSFNPKAYTETENAEWNHQIAELKRKAKKDLTLTANGGYTYKNTMTSNNSSTIDLGLSGNYKGVSVTPGISFPLGGDDKSFIATLGVSVNPNKFKTDSIDKKIDTLDERQELLNIETAVSKYEDKVTAQQLELENILWDRTVIQENLKTNKNLEKDMKSWYQMGVITESKYLSAKVDREKYDVQMVKNLIDMIIYNDTTTSLFYSDVNTGVEND